MKISIDKSRALNAICPYFTMFPIEFPLSILRNYAEHGDQVLDPFCGRGTTNYAARLVGLYSLGVDSSPVASAITQSKLVVADIDEILSEARKIIAHNKKAQNIPSGEFWEWAYHPDVLEILCRFREELLVGCTTGPRIALRGIILGALHGPRQKNQASYFSNQCPRTYAPKPRYSIRYWKNKSLIPQPVDFLSIVERRTKRYFQYLPDIAGTARFGDSRNKELLQPESSESQFKWVITSPPYYGMRTYIPDQWLRNWFVGGPDSVTYDQKDQIQHSSPIEFATNLRKVWQNVADVCKPEANLIIRFGGITNRRSDPIDLIKNSLNGTYWKIVKIDPAGTANEGKRQADSFLRFKSNPITEYDIWAKKI